MNPKTYHAYLDVRVTTESILIVRNLDIRIPSSIEAEDKYDINLRICINDDISIDTILKKSSYIRVDISVYQLTRLELRNIDNPEYADLLYLYDESK